MSKLAGTVCGIVCGKDLNANKVQLGSLLNQIPLRSDALFWLDGVIVTVGENKYFRDKTTNARNFLITGYDFDSTWVAGMPYKSAATISAPAADATLIAADINNYLYDSGGTPNQIPVVSLFQDVDYEHKLFCRHISQVVDGNGVETREPRVVDIVLYNNVKATIDLSICQDYYGVPTEITTNVKWVAKTGNDTTGTGTKAEPYLTINKGISSSSTSGTIYVKSGSYIETGSTTYNIRILAARNISGIGNVIINPGNTDTYIIRCEAAGIVNLTNLQINATGVTYGLYLNAAEKWLKNCKVYGATSKNIRIGSDGIVDKCIIEGNGILVAANATGSIINSLFKHTGNYFTENANTGEFKYINNKFNSITPSTTYLIQNPNAGTNTYIGNTFNLYSNTIPLIWLISTVTQTFNFTYNKINSVGILNNGIIKADATITATVIIEYNEFNNSGATSTSNGFIDLVNQPNVIIRYNKFVSETLLTMPFVNLTSTGKTIDVKVSYNRIISKSESGYIIAIGTEATSANDDKITSEIIGNSIIGGLYYDAGKTGTNHSIFVGHNLNSEIKYNRVQGGFIGLVVKHTGGVYITAVQYNLFYNCNHAILPKGVDGLKIINNTISYDRTGISTTINGIKSETHTVEMSNVVIKNNIINLITQNSASIIINDGGEVGLSCDYNTYYCTSNRFKYQGNTLTFAEWKLLGLDENSDEVNPNLINLIPATSISGVDLGEDYDTGLDVTTTWGSATTLPAIVTKQQPATWQKGAYIQD